MRLSFVIALILCVFATGVADESAAGTTRSSSSSTSKKCHEFFDDFQEIWNKAKEYAYDGKACKALYYGRKAQRKMKRAPSSCTKDPDWHSIVIDWKAGLSDFVYKYKQRCN